jgi:hypothetical protein
MVMYIYRAIPDTGSKSHFAIRNHVNRLIPYYLQFTVIFTHLHHAHVLTGQLSKTRSIYKEASYGGWGH